MNSIIGDLDSLTADDIVGARALYPAETPMPTPTCSVITILQTTLPNMAVGVAYGLTITASGGTAPYRFSLTAGALPAGMTLTAAGALAGTPTTAGTSTFTIRGTDANGCFAAASYTMVIPTVVTLQPPGPPLNFLATLVGTSVYLGWEAPNTGGAPTSYTIEAGSVIGAANLATLSTVTTTYSASNVGAGTYYLRVRAVNAAGSSAPSNEAILVMGQGR